MPQRRKKVIGHSGATPSTTIRDYRKGNWTLEETLILITAKKLDDERRISSTTTGNRGELRWKWVENYCWSNGCLRSQNQCNDKWDNLLRDYKKVREYELRARNSNNNSLPSYWSMDKAQRKDRNLPSNMLLNIYEALNEVVQKKHPPNRQQQAAHLQHYQQPPLAVLPPPPLPPAAPLPEVPPPASEASAESSETQGDSAEKHDTEIKRRRVRDIGSSIIHSTTLLSETLKQCDEKKERRHRELMELERQRLHLEETRTEVNRQGMAGLITSINKLSDAIHSLISEKRP
ncbi:Myb-like domain-containing protein [Artemisia annua]|uniref:Myb-like domain-containing protein n=1 Tax=Artemisia annua TaxID=35608 RepID=A0A2U1L859_ARTAN|nr:Myb-like domain-containing protein [Artemisia annua]